MGNVPFLTALSMFTLVAVVALSVWQFRSIRRSQQRHGEKPGEVKTAHLPPDPDVVAPGGQLTTPATTTADAVSAGAGTSSTGDDTTRSAQTPDRVPL